MNNRFLLFALCVMLSLLGRAQVLPTFSADQTETWHYVQFCNGKAVLQDMGEGELLLTQPSARNDSQLWKFVGTATDFELVSKAGRHVYYDTTSKRFCTSASQSGHLQLVATSNATYAPAWEIQTASYPGYSMNSWGGVGAGHQVGAWNPNDPNNPLLFVPQSEMGFKDVEPDKLKEYSVSGRMNFTPEHAMTLWYDQPVTSQTVADPWMDYALPIGNGQLGGMVYGGIHQDVVQFNEKTLWEGSSTQRGAYYNFGNLYAENLDSTLSTGVTNYVRLLDIENATAKVFWNNQSGQVNYERDYLASEPDQVIAIRLKANQSGKINQKYYLYNVNGSAPAYDVDGYGVMEGKLTTVSYNARFKVVAEGGTLTADSTGVTVKGADEVLVVMHAATDYDPTAPSYVSGTADLADRVKALVDKAAAKGWEQILADHVADYQSLYGRVSLDLNAGENNVPTNKLIASYNSTNSASAQRLLEQMYFQYGRYLLIASSRGVDLPNNLQGIWNNRASDSFWQCDMHADVNVQMNYWPAEKTNLSELHNKYLNYLYNMAIVQPQWRNFAKERSHQTLGWVNYVENNIFGHCSTWENEHYPDGGAWACSHLWQHYRYTMNEDFLEKKALPVMLGCVDFWMERLVKNSADGTWECPNEFSPEHGPIENATAHSQQLVWNLFSNTIEAVNTVGLSKAGITADRFNEIKEKFAHIDDGLHLEAYPGTSERFGVLPGDSILREWKTSSYLMNDESHRHLSHLMALYPLNRITPDNRYFQPAVRSLKLRGIRSQGWSMGWKMCLWARAQQGDSCRNIFKLAFRHCDKYEIDMSPNAGGVYYNLLDAHSPFQIDGNFGVCAGMAEMLLQNNADTLLLLPALPADWADGKVSGLRAEGNFEVGMQWSKGKLQQASFQSFSGRPLYVACLAGKSGNYVFSDTDGNKLTPIYHANGIVGFNTKAGKTYTMKWK